MALGSLIRFTNDISKSQLIHTSGGLRSSLVVLPDHDNMGLALGIVLLTGTEAEIHVVFLLPVNCRRTVFPLVSPCCPTPKARVEPLEFLCYHVYELRYTLVLIYFQLMAAICRLDNI